MRTEKELLLDCLERLNHAAIPYMLVGSMASNYWGIPRTTHDLDFVIVLDPTKIDQLASAFASGFFLQVESIRGALSPPHQFNAIDEQSALKIDFWVLRRAPFEQSAFNRRRQVSIFGTAAWVTTAEDVILHKFYWHKISPSDRQLRDAAGVYAVQRGSLDINDMRVGAANFDVEEELAPLLAGAIKPKST